ncbi:MAG: hypothetical protein N7Q72_06825 [Spiroplasma sp. Tabriz.8]|nr:hypothetical protein [Spiroplasma sp. Tabriz.8]
MNFFNSKNIWVKFKILFFVVIKFIYDSFIYIYIYIYIYILAIIMHIKI